MMIEDDDVWVGGFFMLALQYAPGEDLQPALDGLVRRLSTVTDSQLATAEDVRIDPLVATLELPTGNSLPCKIWIVEAEDVAWIELGIPMGAVDRFYPTGGYPFEEAGNSEWILMLQEVFRSIAGDVYEEAPFLLAVIGYEVCGEPTAQEIARDGVPRQRSVALLLPTPPAGLQWYPINQG
jgi:hypothetical protein